MAKRVDVVQDENEPIATQVLATSIVKIADSAKKALNSGLSRRALIVLLKDSSGVPQNQIEAVLKALETLAETYAPTRRKK